MILLKEPKEMKEKTLTGYIASALIITLLASVVLMPFKYVEAQNAIKTKLGDVLSGDVTEKITTKLKADHPELASLGEKLQTMNLTQTLNELVTILELSNELVKGIKNLQGNMSAAK